MFKKTVVSPRDVLASNATGFVVQVIYLLNLGINKNSNFQLDCILYDISQNYSPSNQPHLHLSNEKTFITFHFTGCLIGIPMVGCNKPYNKGQYITPYTTKKQPAFFSLLISHQILKLSNCKIFLQSERQRLIALILWLSSMS